MITAPPPVDGSSALERGPWRGADGSLRRLAHDELEPLVASGARLPRVAVGARGPGLLHVLAVRILALREDE